MPERTTDAPKETAAAVVLRHRQQCAALRVQFDRASDQLHAAIPSAEELAELMRQARNGDRVAQLELMAYALALPKLVATTLHLTKCLENLIKMERQAYGIRDQDCATQTTLPMPATPFPAENAERLKETFDAIRARARQRCLDASTGSAAGQEDVRLA
jgi:hypothetical protein